MRNELTHPHRCASWCVCTVVSIVPTVLCLGEMPLVLVWVMGKRICGHKVCYEKERKKKRRRKKERKHALGRKKENGGVVIIA